MLLIDVLWVILYASLLIVLILFVWIVIYSFVSVAIKQWKRDRHANNHG